jgi:hypothetical protein
MIEWNDYQDIWSLSDLTTGASPGTKDGSVSFGLGVALSPCGFSTTGGTAQQSRNQSVWPFTPKAFANYSPGLERSDNPGITALLGINNAESVGKLANSFGVDENLLTKTRS